MLRRPGARRGSDGWRQNVGDAVRRSAELRRVATIRALALLARTGVVLPELVPFADLAAEELRGWISSAGGENRLSAMRRSLLEDAAVLGIPMRAEIGRYLATKDTDAATRASTLANSRRASLCAAGLDRAEPEDVDLRGYLEGKAKALEAQPAQEPLEPEIDVESQPAARAGSASTSSGDALGAPTAKENGEEVSEHG